MRLDDEGNGITRDSVRFFRDHRHELGEITSAELRFPGFGDPFDPYLMVLRDANGNEMRLSGCTTGYNGEGPRAAMQLLVEAGFPATHAQGVFSEPTIVLSRPPASAVRAVHPQPPATGASAAARRRAQVRPRLEREVR